MSISANAIEIAYIFTTVADDFLLLLNLRSRIFINRFNVNILRNPFENRVWTKRSLLVQIDGNWVKRFQSTLIAHNPIWQPATNSFDRNPKLYFMKSVECVIKIIIIPG